VEPTGITFFVSGEPKPQPRPRAFVRRAKGGKAVAGVYNQEGKVAIWRADVRAAAREHFEKPLEGAIELRIRIHQRPPKGWPKYRMKEIEEGKLFPDLRKTGDWDNYGKAVSDALNGIAYHDDSQVWRGVPERVYSRRSGAEVTIIESDEKEAIEKEEDNE